MKRYNWHNINELIPEAILENKFVPIVVADREVLLLKRADKLFAFVATCPHAGAPLCEGWIDALGRVVCPLHQYRFDPGNGRNTSGEGYKLMTYPIEMRDEGIFLGLTANIF